MKFIRKQHDKVAPLFEKGGKFEKLHPVWEAHDTVLFTPGLVTKFASHVRDALDQKRMMITVVVALFPCVLMALFNTGYQAHAAIADGAYPLFSESGALDWHYDIFHTLGFTHLTEGSADYIRGTGAATVSFWTIENMVLGALFFVPVWFVGLAAGGFWEVLFGVIRRHSITEGFLVTSTLLPLICPPTIPLWQIAVGMSFGIVIGKEIFGGVGMNILNPALTARAFLFFAYPAEISGDKPWLPFMASKPDGAGIAESGPAFGELCTNGVLSNGALPHSSTGPTYLSHAASGDVMSKTPEFFADAPTKYNVAGSWEQNGITSPNSDCGTYDMTLGGAEWMDAFMGTIPGSMGETSVLACLIGAVILIMTKVGSWRTMLGCIIGTAVMALTLNYLGSNSSNAMMHVPFWWHFVIGGWAFGMVFMATDPVSSPFTERGKLIYGFLIGVLVVLVRCVNPAYAEGMMLAILFMNMFAPLIDHFIVQKNIKKRMARDVV